MSHLSSFNYLKSFSPPTYNENIILPCSLRTNGRHNGSRKLYLHKRDTAQSSRQILKLIKNDNKKKKTLENLSVIKQVKISLKSAAIESLVRHTQVDLQIEWKWEELGHGRSSFEMENKRLSCFFFCFFFLRKKSPSIRSLTDSIRQHGRQNHLNTKYVWFLRSNTSFNLKHRIK